MVEVLGLLCESLNYLVALRVPDRSAMSLKPIFDDFAQQATLVVSDQWSGYNFLSDAGWNHMAVNHSA